MIFIFVFGVGVGLGATYYYKKNQNPYAKIDDVIYQGERVELIQE